jgi:hypothetical protein
VARRPLRRLNALTTALATALAAPFAAPPRARLVSTLTAAVTVVSVSLTAGACGAASSTVPGPASTSPASSPASGPATSPHRTITPPPAPGTAEEAALAVVTAWFSYDTRVDTRPNDTARRLALPWLAPDLRQQVITYSTGTGPGASWESWAARHAWGTVAAGLGGDDHPPDTVGTAQRQVVATVTLHGDDGWTTTLRRTCFLHLDLLSGRWLVTDLQTSED